MPKIVDHEQRRAEIVRIIIEVIAEEGLNGTTVRTISRKGGFTSGVLSHYFANKDEMIKFAFAGVADMIFERVDERLKTARGADRIRAIVEEHIPVGDHQDEAAVALAFWEVALHDPPLREQFRSNYGRWRRYLVREMRTVSPDLSNAELEGRIDLAIATADGLLVMFAVDGANYDTSRRTALVDSLLRVMMAGTEMLKPVSA